MKNYESPTIESAGGTGNEIEPQVFVLLVDFAVMSEWMYVWVFYKITGVPSPPVA